LSVVLGLDPGFAHVGYALVSVTSEAEQPLELGVISTKKNSNKQNVYASDDNLRRGREITHELQNIFKSSKSSIRALCVETMSFPRNAAVAAKMAMCWGVVAALSEFFNIPVVQVTPQQLKVALGLQRNATKPEVCSALQTRFGAKLLEGQLAHVSASLHEHPLDALGAVVACRDSDLIRLLRNQ
jgi:crossover junction endodeoxyribonuclease RuvC